MFNQNAAIWKGDASRPVGNRAVASFWEVALSRWTLTVMSAVVLPLLPPLAIVSVGYVFPGKIAWSLANAAIPIGAFASVLVGGFLLVRNSGSVFFRSACFILIAFAMSQFARVEFFTSQACVTQQGRFIDIQRQEREIRAAQGPECG